MYACALCVCSMCFVCFVCFVCVCACVFARYLFLMRPRVLPDNVQIDGFSDMGGGGRREGRTDQLSASGDIRSVHRGRNRIRGTLQVSTATDARVYTSDQRQPGENERLLAQKSVSNSVVLQRCGCFVRSAAH